MTLKEDLENALYNFLYEIIDKESEDWFTVREETVEVDIVDEREENNKKIIEADISFEVITIHDTGYGELSATFRCSGSATFVIEDSKIVVEYLDFGVTDLW